MDKAYTPAEFSEMVPRKRLTRTKFSKEDDERLRGLVEKFGTDAWDKIVRKMPTKNKRQCRDRWFSFLDPSIKNGPWSEEEDDLLRSKVEEFGPSWVNIAKYFPGRTDVNIKNRWSSLLRREKNGEESPRRRLSPTNETNTIEKPTAEVTMILPEITPIPEIQLGVPIQWDLSFIDGSCNNSTFDFFSYY